MKHKYQNYLAEFLCGFFFVQKLSSLTFLKKKITNFKCDWISISLRNWCSTHDFISCDLNKTYKKKQKHYRVIYWFN